MPSVVCYASGKSHKSFIRPPLKLKAGVLKSATILVDYIGFPDNARLAFQYAVDIWKNLIYSPVPIHVQAKWISLDKNVLGSCRSADYKADFNSTQIWNCYYPVALVEKMLGEEVNAANDYEIEASFNKDFSNWYFGTDGNTPTKQYDFVSVVLHEMTHGLGFIGNFNSKSGKGGYSSEVDNYPAVFDQFVENKAGDILINTKLFANPSVKLNQNLTSRELYFDQLVAGKLPRLYAPSTWDGGSSIYHLDDATYPAGTANALMTHASDMGEAIHDPGPYTMAIMDEMGWKNISIKHKQLKDIEYTTEVSFDAQITSDYGLNLNKIYLVYSSNKFAKSDSVLLKTTNLTDIFNAKLTKNLFGEIDYYFSATDVKNKRYVLPSKASSRYMSFKIGIDKESPVVTHDPIKYMLTDKLTAKIDVVATDNIGIESVKVEYFVIGGLVKTLALKNDSNDQYSGNLVFPAGTVKDGDLVSYRIVATDISSQSNIGDLPLSGFFTFKIQNDTVAPVISHEPFKYLLSTDLAAKINVKATDNLGVKSVKLEYFVNGGSINDLILKNDSIDYYSVDLVIPASLVKNGDQVSYRIIATDVSSQSNIGYLPLTGYFKFSIEGIQSPVDKYVNDFNTVTSDFIGADFNIVTATGFDNPALNSAHPYLSPDTDNMNFNFSSILRYPVILKDGGKMSYDEIVLVEPGDPGTIFGDPNFFDYVIVEGSTDGGITWKPLTDGYDSNIRPSWAKLFSSSISGNNSTAVPTKDLFVKHEINLLANGNFKAGETILVRFRLFSDPYSNGWGWIVDNLNIQDVGTAVNPILLSPGEVNLFPNPASSKVNLQIQAEKKIHNLLLKIYNSSGKMVSSQSFPVESNLFETVIDVSNLIPGLYLFALEPEKRQVITRKILVH